jgi:hypothetical protein
MELSSSVPLYTAIGMYTFNKELVYSYSYSYLSTDILHTKEMAN